jgi:hypothetical protein
VKRFARILDTKLVARICAETPPAPHNGRV